MNFEFKNNNSLHLGLLENRIKSDPSFIVVWYEKFAIFYLYYGSSSQRKMQKYNLYENKLTLLNSCLYRPAICLSFEVWEEFHRQKNFYQLYKLIFPD